MSLHIKLIALLVGVLALAGAAFGIHAHGISQGKKIERATWLEKESARVQAENAAILARVRNNERIAEQQEIDRQRITKAHHDELAQVRADIARAPRLRIGPAICAGPASTSQATSTSRSDAADPGGRLVREDIRR